MRVSVVILTRDEEDNIGAALESVSWCNEILVVDSRSLDSTREIVKDHGATVVDAPRAALSEPYDHLRHLGIESASNELILLLDADESLSRDLQIYLKDYLRDLSDDIQVIRAPVLNYIGTELLVRGWPNFKPVIVRRDTVEFKRDVHDFLRINGVRVRDLDDRFVHDVPVSHKLAVHHHLADSVYERLRAQRRYARIAGHKRQFSLAKLLLAPPWGLYDRICRQSGWRDGFYGLGLGLCYSWFLFETQLRAGISTICNRLQ